MYAILLAARRQGERQGSGTRLLRERVQQAVLAFPLRGAHAPSMPTLTLTMLHTAHCTLVALFRYMSSVLGGA